MPDVLEKFHKDSEELLLAVEGQKDLRSNYRLYKKLHKFYKAEGVIFTGDADVDYHILIGCLKDDLVFTY